MVDPDGELIGDPPIEVTCIFGAGNGAITEIDNLNKDIIVAFQKKSIIPFLRIRCWL